MFFCGTCTNQKQKQHEIEIRASNDADVFKRVSRDNEQLLSTIMKEIPSFTMVVPSDYDKELKNCREKNKKFVDNSFPPNAKSLNFSINNRKIVWKRITEIVGNAKLVQDDINPADVQQGNVGDCYFLACIASIAEVPQRIRRIFCHDMEISQEGIYRMQIVEQGVYKEVVIDDFVPVFEGTNRPVFCRPIGNQVWVMLLEKVWAKLSGSYGDTSAGYPHEVLSTFLVAPCFYEDIPFTILKQQNQMQKLWQKLKQASKHDMPICAGSRQAYTCKGIKAAHTYSILETYQLESGNFRTRLLKLRNPWGDAQYMGRYSEHDTAFWATVSPTLKLAIFQKQSENDGIFTIEFSQFVRNFQCVDISHDVPDYNNFFTKVEAKSCEPVFFELKIENISALDCYITVEKAFDRNAYVRTRRVEYGYSRLLIARKKQVLINNELKVTYEYVSSLLQTNFPDLTIRQQSLTPGTYTIMAQSEFPTQQTGHLTVSIYSKSIMNLEPIPSPDRYFLHAVLTNHAHTLVPVGERVRLSEESSEDWMVSRFLFREGGYGYTCVVLGPGSREKVQVTGNIGKIYQSGFLVQERNIKKQEGELNILVERNQQSIIIFQIDFKRDIKKIAFPPKGLRMARII